MVPQVKRSLVALTHIAVQSVLKGELVSQKPIIQGISTSEVVGVQVLRQSLSAAWNSMQKSGGI